MAKEKKINLKAELQKYANQITRLFQKEIKKQKLINTGLMYAVTECELKETTKGLKYEIFSTGYFEFVDARFQVENNVLNSPAYKKIEAEIENTYNLYLIQQLFDGIN